MLEWRNNEQLDADARASAERSRQQSQPMITALSAYVSKAFSDAEEHRQRNGITERLLKCLRQKSGQYDPSKLAAIRARGGTDMFFNITETKCEAFEAWLEDVFAPIGDRAWDATPTPIPTLPSGVAQNVVEATVAQFAGDPSISPQQVQEFASDLYDETLRQMFDDARKRCERMVEKMEDQTVEGGMIDAFSQFVSDLGTYPSAILKGPVFTRHRRLHWNEGQVDVQYEVIPTWHCVDPKAFYPGANARHVNESYICELIDYDRRLLSEMRGVEGWDTAALETVLSGAVAGAGGGDPEVTGEQERATLENRDPDRNQGMPDATVRAIEFWGSVPGRMLQEWGMSDIDDLFAYYEISCILIGGMIVRAVLNPDPLDRRPYFVTSFIRNKNSLWGLKAIPEKMADCQEGVNGSQRNLLNNLAIASGPQVVVDSDAIAPSHLPTVNEIWPWKVWCIRGTKTQQQAPIKFFQPGSNASELIQVSEYYEQKADDRTLIPRYIYGEGDMTGAGATASGLSMLMNAASRGIKRVIKNVDRDVLRPAIERLYTWNMMYLDDDSLKGDVQVVPRGALALLVREQTQMRRQEFLNMTNNPIDLQIVGLEGRANLLREVAKGLDISVEKIIPSEEDMKRRLDAQMAHQQPPEAGNEQDGSAPTPA